MNEGDVKEGFLPKGEVFLSVSSCFMPGVEEEDASGDPKLSLSLSDSTEFS